MDDDAVPPQADGHDCSGAGNSLDWIGIERSYRDSTLTIAQICSVFSVGQTQLYRRINAENWPKRSELGKQAGATGRQMGTNPSANEVRYARSGGGAAGRGVAMPTTKRGLSKWRQNMISRLYAAIDRQLAEIERQQRGGQEISGAERERQTRQMNTMTRSMEKLADVYDQESRRSKGGKKSVGKKSSTNQRDPETWRLEIARRITRIRENWLAEEASRDS